MMPGLRAETPLWASQEVSKYTHQAKICSAWRLPMLEQVARYPQLSMSSAAVVVCKCAVALAKANLTTHPAAAWWNAHEFDSMR